MTEDLDPADRVVSIYRRHAAAFDRDRGRGLVERPWLDRFLDRLPGAAVLDLGCGGGEPIARYLIERGCRVTGVDASLPLVDLGRTRFPEHEWIVQDMRGLDLGRRFDGVLAWNSFFHLSWDDQRAMFEVFAAHAGPGAPLLFTTGPAHGTAIGSFEGEPLHHASLDPDEYRELLASHGFEVVEHAIEDQECGGATVWLARRS
ncbi:class I SAM-dependent DNA methyltransferase [Paludisphaera soli]|uniref:class I SAM-dependent DNA methyltransferase n=1 Tax=Paludisphaera soli TaxID=2712865 RepID=UPI001F0F6AD7|nr:class I SAM-dependent methyltransferase [Paludisphaera soli]